LKSIVAANYLNFADLDQWRLRKVLAGGGALVDIGIYCLNAARYFTGEEPTEVTAIIYTTPGDNRFKEVEESVYWTMKFPSGCIAHLSCSYGALATNPCTITGDKGKITLTQSFAYHGVGATITIAGKQEEKLDFPDINQFAEEVDYFAVCIKEGKTPITPGEDGLQDQIIMEAIYRAAAEGRVVKLT